MSEQLISSTSESDKASQLYQRHAEVASLRDPYADHLDSLEDAQTRLDEIKKGGLRSKIANHQEAKELGRKLFNTQAVNALASKFHEQWRSDRLQEDGTFEPREKSTKDAAWIEAHGTDLVDIANTDFANLPKDWQAENATAAGVVVDILAAFNGNIDLSDESTRNDDGDIVHTAWLARNKWAEGGELDVPFANLSAEEQAEDINQVSTALEVVKS